MTRPTSISNQVAIQVHRTTSRFFTGIAFVFCSSAGLVCGLEAIKVAAPHIAKHSKTIAVFVIQCIGRFQASLTGSFSQASEISKAINARAVSIGPARLQRIAAYQIKADKLKTFVTVIHMRARDVAQHIRFASAYCARTGAAEKLQREVRLRLVVPRERQFVADHLRVS